MLDIVKSFQRLETDWVDKFLTIDESASINESLPINGALSHNIRPIWTGSRFCGSAFTVEARPGDNLILHKALELIQPGDVLIISYSGFLESGGMFGGVMSTIAKEKGCVGLVTDGAVRDTKVIKDIAFPVYSGGINVKSTTKRAGGKINNPINICDVTVQPGDLVYGDDDAVVIVPKKYLAEVYEKASKREEQEEVTLNKFRSSGTIPFEQFEKTFSELGLTEEK
ncbi:RraA family protein [Oceanobacillus jeddahense]|uniref:Putative 4-hydroxy-4-methyl-2-oxoglutarate aldolase n=1 Tax=Oceanobacillus jeddahense TaxID=1462527 RepID=A0ABY5JRS5_9BACI|nr:hypothetical protein [Oceanobacillus jeddahense]UUI03032.1 hypothetical protein NP439_23875 [Oceanobacillus jeddahense]